MRLLIACSTALALVACSEAQAPEPVVEEPVEEMADAESAVVPGTYEVTWPDGSVGTTVVNDDGTYTGTQGDETQSGTVTDVDGKACFDAEGDGEGAVCWTASEPGEDGTFTSTADDGTVVTVKPMDAEAEAEEDATT